MDPNNPPRWAADPTGRHQYRYWDGSGWTDQVSDNGAVSTDPPVASPQVPTPTPTPEPAPEPTPAPFVVPSAVPPAPGGVWAPPGESAPPPGYGAVAPAYGAAPPVPAFVPSPPTSSAPWYGTQDSTAVLGRRYGAFFIDLLICLVAFGLIFTAFATQRTVAETLALPGCHYAKDSSAADSNRQIECNNRAVFRAGDTVYEADLGITVGSFLLLTLLLFMLPEALAGASLGKLMTGVRVVRPDGGRIGIGRSLLRWLLFWVDGPITLFLCGIISSSVTRGHRRVGDMAADSYVVGKDGWGRPVSLPPAR